jgi:hypothetical protein
MVTKTPEVPISECPYVLVLQTNENTPSPFDPRLTQLRFTVKIFQQPDVQIVVHDVKASLSTLVATLDRECGFRSLVAEFRSDTNKFLQRTRSFADYNVKNDSVIELIPRTNEALPGSGLRSLTTAVPFKATPIVLSRPRSTATEQSVARTMPVEIKCEPASHYGNTRDRDSPPPRRAAPVATVLPPRSGVPQFTSPKLPVLPVRNAIPVPGPAPAVITQMDSDYDRLLAYGHSDDSDSSEGAARRKKKNKQQQQQGNKKQKPHGSGNTPSQSRPPLIVNRGALLAVSSHSEKSNYYSPPPSHGAHIGGGLDRFDDARRNTPSNRDSCRSPDRVPVLSSDDDEDHRRGANNNSTTARGYAPSIASTTGGGGGSRVTYAPSKMYTGSGGGGGGGGGGGKVKGGSKNKRTRYDSSDGSDGGEESGRAFWER